MTRIDFVIARTAASYGLAWPIRPTAPGAASSGTDASGTDASGAAASGAAASDTRESALREFGSLAAGAPESEFVPGPSRNPSPNTPSRSGEAPGRARGESLPLRHARSPIRSAVTEPSFSARNVFP